MSDQDKDIKQIWGDSFKERAERAPGAMEPQEIEEFLQRPLLFRLACVTPEGKPYITVCWHEWKDDGFYLVVRARSRWADHLVANPLVSFLVDTEWALQRVWGEGTAEVIHEPVIDGAWVDVCMRMCERYGMPWAYMEATRQQPRWLFHVKPTKTRTWQGTGWSQRYWVEGKGPSYEEAQRSV